MSAGLLAVPCMGDLSVPVVRALVALVNQLPAGSRYVFLDTWTTPSTKRNVAVEMLLDDPSLQWLVMSDADMTPPPGGVDLLLEHEADVVAGTCLERRDPHPIAAGVVAAPGDPPDPHRRSDSEGFRGRALSPLEVQGPTEVDFVGTGFVLIHRRVFEALEPPWFAPNVAWHRGFGRSEDVNFCLAARAEGFRIVLAPEVSVGHVVSQELRPSFGTAARDRQSAAGGGAAEPADPRPAAPATPGRDGA